MNEDFEVYRNIYSSGYVSNPWAVSPQTFFAASAVETIPTSLPRLPNSIKLRPLLPNRPFFFKGQTLPYLKE